MLKSLQGVSLLAFEDRKGAKKSFVYFPGRVLCIPSPGTTERYHRKPNFSRLLTHSVPREVNECFESRTVAHVSLHIFTKLPLKLMMTAFKLRNE